MNFNPDEDGVTHINIYSKGLTQLGRLLSNFALTPFTCPDGYFLSVEGYWYWLGTNHLRRDELRNVHGFQAKKLGRELQGLDWNEDLVFMNKILLAFECKLENNSIIKDLLKKSILPFEHYYNYSGKIYDIKKKCWWVIKFWEDKRKQLKGEFLI